MRVIPILLLVLALSACGEKKEVKDTVFGPTVQTKDKARAVEDKLKEGADKKREAVKAAEQEEPKLQGY